MLRSVRNLVKCVIRALAKTATNNKGTRSRSKALHNETNRPLEQRSALAETTLEQRSALAETTLEQRSALAETTLEQQSALAETTLEQRSALTETTLEQRRLQLMQLLTASGFVP